MQERDGGPDGPTSQGVVLKRQPEELPIEGKRHDALVHVQIDAQNALLFERLAVLATICVTAMAQLAKPIETKTEVIVAEGVSHAEFLLGRHTDFELVLSASVRYDFPVVLSVHEGSIRDHGAEEVIGFVEKSVPIVA